MISPLKEKQWKLDPPYSAQLLSKTTPFLSDQVKSFLSGQIKGAWKTNKTTKERKEKKKFGFV